MGAPRGERRSYGRHHAGTSPTPVPSSSAYSISAHKTAGGWLILIGFAVNAAIPPLHAWLSDAYPEATVTGSVFLSAFTTKTAVYVLAVGFAGWELLVWAGVAMALYGVVYAMLANDIRRLLAYHIISQVGYMVAAVGIGTELAVNGATAHAFAHIIYKGLMFMGAGAVLHTVGTARASELGGLARFMPAVMVLYMVGAVSISGFPLFSGFVSKSMVIGAAVEDHRNLVGILLNVASVGTFLSTGLKLPYFTWVRTQPGRCHDPRRSPGHVRRHGGSRRAVPCHWRLSHDALQVAPFHRGLYALYCGAPGGKPPRFSWALRWSSTCSSESFSPTREPPLTSIGSIGRAPGQPTLPWSKVRAWVLTRIEAMAVSATNALTRLASNPVAYFPQVARRLGIESSALEGDGVSAPPFNPDRYRLSVGLGVALVLLAFVAVAFWALVAL